MKPRLLDLFSGAGGCTKGYQRAGFYVGGVDINPQPNYCGDVFHQVDALEWLATWSRSISQIFDAIHASPPCQHFTAYGRAVKDIKERYEDLLEPTRELLQATGLPYVIENVVGAPLDDPVTLCGSMFDLDVQRHRLFETNWDLRPPVWPCRHKIWSRRFKSSTGRKPNSRFTIEVGSWDEPLDRQKAAMGVDWKISTRELSEAIPPASRSSSARLRREARLPDRAARVLPAAHHPCSSHPPPRMTGEAMTDLEARSAQTADARGGESLVAVLVGLLRWQPQTARVRAGLHPQHRAAIEAAESALAALGER